MARSVANKSVILGADIRVSVQRDIAGSSSFDTVATVAGVTADGWVAVSAEYQPPPVAGDDNTVSEVGRGQCAGL
jgi:hypothetical protein